MLRLRAADSACSLRAAFALSTAAPVPLRLAPPPRPPAATDPPAARACDAPSAPSCQQNMSRAGYADFFPTAPSVLASKKAQADRDAREKARQLQQREVSRRQAQTALHDDYVRDTSGVRSAGSASSTSTATGSVPTYLLAQNLTPSTSNSSPPAQLSPANGAKTDVQVRSAALAGSHRDAPPAIPTPKATPPAAPAPPSNRPKNYLITYDPFLEKDAKKHSQPTYRFNGDGVSRCIPEFCGSGVPPGHRMRY